MKMEINENFQQKYSEKSENIIGLDYLNLIWIYISYCRTSLLKLLLQYDSLAFISSSFRVTEVKQIWPTLFLLNVFTALKGTLFYILFSRAVFFFFFFILNSSLSLQFVFKKNSLFCGLYRSIRQDYFTRFNKVTH